MVSADERTRRVRVLVLADRPLVSAALTAALLTSEELDAWAASPGELPDEGSGEGADVFVVAGPRALSRCRSLKARDGARVVVLGLGDPRPEIVASIESGADGFVSADGAVAELVEAVHVVAGGGAWISPELLGTLLRSLIAGRRVPDRPDPGLAALTRRECEVLALLVEGCGRPEIATRLHVSPNTVRTHIQNVLNKLGVHSQMEAVSYAVQHDFDWQSRQARDRDAS